ncbi:MAG: GspE/PulE family protein [Planctomycetota bacterium]|jgi:general secretion pathway protein E/type IV pilus assembly protein PilB
MEPAVNEDGYHPIRIAPGLAGLSEQKILAAADEAKRQRITLRQSVLQLGFVTEAELLAAVSEKTGLCFIENINGAIDPQAPDAVSANVASHYNIMPLSLRESKLRIATADPFDPNLRKEIELVLDNAYQIEFVLATSEHIVKAIRKTYGVGAATVEQMVTDEQVDSGVSSSEDIMEDNMARQASVIKLVNQILADAIGDGATDIHIEPYEDHIKIRYRVDGILHDAGVPATVRFFREGIASRVKIMSGLDIAEKRLPQDGRSQVTHSGNTFDLRISVLPTRYGEAINIRILPQSTLISDLPFLGISEKEVTKLTGLIRKPHGIILVTGPTGSGKTTTLYTCMNLLKNTDKKIITIEDPVECDMPGIVQMQVQPEIGFTFARALRSMLRHDPDIMLVGEIRDLETAETAIRTALTGHLVFSTLHTNDAASAVTRLLDMGIEPYLAASSIEAILAQRLVRVICPHCKEPYEPESEAATAIMSMAQLDKLPRAYRGIGCAKCRFTGFHGRTAITELLILSDEIRRMTISRRHSNEIDAQAHAEGMSGLFQSGLEKIRNAITTYEEILRVTKGTVVMD